MRQVNGPILVLCAGLALWPLLALWVLAGPAYVIALAAVLEIVHRLRLR